MNLLEYVQSKFQRTESGIERSPSSETRNHSLPCPPVRKVSAPPHPHSAPPYQSPRVCIPPIQNFPGCDTVCSNAEFPIIIIIVVIIIIIVVVVVVVVVAAQNRGYPIPQVNRNGGRYLGSEEKEKRKKKDRESDSSLWY